MFPFPLSPGCRSHLVASHQSKTHHKATASQDESPGPQPASAMASAPGIIQNFLPKKRGCCLSPACGDPASCIWGIPRSRAPAERDGAQQEVCQVPPALAAVTTPSRDMTASKEEPCPEQCQRNAVHPAHPFRQSENHSHTCGCVGGEGKLALKSLGCRRVSFPLKNETQAPG